MGSSQIAVSIIVATIIVAGGLAAWFLLEPRSTTPGTPITDDCPTCLALAPPTESSSAGLDLYNFSIASAPTGATWGEVTVQVQTASGAAVSTQGTGWNVSIRTASGTLVAVYDIQAAVPGWTTGEMVAPMGGDSLLMTSPAYDPLSGDNLYCHLGGGFGGTTSITIP
jgi:hypothetical protein